MERWVDPDSLLEAQLAMGERVYHELLKSEQRWTAKLRHGDRPGTVKVHTWFDEETGPVVSIALDLMPESIAAMLTEVWTDPARERVRRLRKEAAANIA